MLKPVRSNRSLFLPLLLAALAACEESEEPRSPATSRSVELSFGDAARHRVRVSRVMVTLTHIKVYSRSARAWVTAVDYGDAGRPLNLLTLHSDNPQGVGAFELPAGRYQDLRLFVRPQGTIEVDEGAGPVTKPLHVHDHRRRGLEVDGRFQVVGEGLTQVALDFDARRSISYGRGHHHGHHVAGVDDEVAARDRDDRDDRDDRRGPGHHDDRDDHRGPRRPGDPGHGPGPGPDHGPGWPHRPGPGDHDHDYHYALHADLDILDAATSRVSSVLVSAAEGGEVHLLGRAGLVIPPGALREDTEIGISVAEIAPAIAARAGVLPGNAVELEPSGLTFDVPVELTLFYDPAALPAGKTADDFGIVSRHPGESWESHPSVAAPDAFLQTALITHFSIGTLAADIDVICPPGTARADKGLCTPASTVRTSCAPSRDIAVKVYDEDGEELSLRDVLWKSSSPSIAGIVPRAVDCSSFTTQATCDAQEGCAFDGAACLQDQRFKTIVRNGCGGSVIEALPQEELPGEPVPGKAVFSVNTKDSFIGTLHTIAIHDDSDPNGSGELYWLFKIGDFDVSDHPGTVDVDSGRSIEVHATASLGSWCEGTPTDFVTKIGDDDGFEEDEVCDKHHGETPFMPGLQALSARCNDGEPEGTFHFSISCVP
jgi:hypothetical protein